MCAVLGLGSLDGWGHFRSSCVISRHRRLCSRQWSAYSRGRQAFLALQSADQSQTRHVHKTCTFTVSDRSAVSVVSKMPLFPQPTIALERSAVRFTILDVGDHGAISMGRCTSIFGHDCRARVPACVLSEI